MLNLFKISAEKLRLSAIGAFTLQAPFNGGPFRDLFLLTHCHPITFLGMKTNATLLTSYGKAHSQHALFERGSYACPSHRSKFWSQCFAQFG